MRQSLKGHSTDDPQPAEIELITVRPAGFEPAEIPRTTNKQNVTGLEVSIIAHKLRYKPNDQMQLDIVLTNYGKRDVFIFSELEFGSAASLLIHIRDASGKEVQPFFDDHTSTSPDDKSAFVKLLPRHFLGTNFFTPVEVLNVNRPGKYSIYVEYQSPFLGTEVKLTPFWGKEQGK